MPHLLSKLTSCINRRHDPKNISLPSRSHFFKLSRFELMPDEILIEIFEYINLIDLYSGFVNLNYRLNYLLRHIEIGINLNQNENHSILNPINYFHNQITYIQIDHYPLLNLKIFPNLRSLTIYLPTKVQLLSIRKDLMPKLRRLWIGIINQTDQIIINKILFGPEQFSKLGYCNLFQIKLNENFNLFKSCLNIRKLLISNSSIKDFLIILSLLPNLYQLDICITDIFLTSLENLTNSYHKNLRILKIEFIEKIAQLNILNCLMSFVPYVEKCTLFLVNLIKIRDYQYLQNILIEKLLQLREFTFFIDYYCQLSSNQMFPKFDKLKIKFPFFQTINVIPCLIHQEKCVRKTWMNKTLIPIC